MRAKVNDGTSEEARVFQKLAQKVMKNGSPLIPTPVEDLS
jgi:hypothetical protein